MEVRPTSLSRATSSTMAPRGTGRLKSTASACTVTTFLRAWRVAATKAAWSIQAKTVPPNRVP